MRKLASFTDLASARTASRALDAADIANDLRVELDARHAVWVLIENQVADARRVLSELEANPAPMQDPPSAEPAPVFDVAVPIEPTAPPAPPAPVPAQQRAYAQPAGTLASLRARARGAPVTVSVLITSFGLAIAGAFGAEAEIRQSLFIASTPARTYQDLLAGEIWRLFTPALVHGGVVHLIFNAIWLLELGAVIERVTGSLRFALLLLVCAAVSNLAQLQLEGNPSFCGLSGVVYGCIGYMWSRGRFDPNSPIGAPPQLVNFFVIWMALGFSGLLASLVGPMANYCHLGGLVAGAACGYVAAIVSKHRLPPSEQH